MKIIFGKNNILILFIIIFDFEYELLARPYTQEIEDIGTAFQFIVPTIAGTRALYDNNESFNQFLKHFLVLNGVTHLMKFLIDEKRPSSDRYESFPSGHTAAAFGGATFVHFRYSFNEAKYLYLMSIFTGFSRLYANKHHAQDVLTSIVLSFLTSYVFVNKKNDKINYSFNYNYDRKEVFFGINAKF